MGDDPLADATGRSEDDESHGDKTCSLKGLQATCDMPLCCRHLPRAGARPAQASSRKQLQGSKQYAAWSYSS